MSDQEKKDRFELYVRASATELAEDFARLLNRAHALFLAVNSDQDDDGVTHTVEWAFDGDRYSMDIDWDMEKERWMVGKVRKW